MWRRGVLLACKELFPHDLANGLGESRREPPKKMKKSNSERYTATAKVVGAGDEKENEGPEGSVRGAGASSDSTSRIVSFATSRFPTQDRSHPTIFYVIYYPIEEGNMLFQLSSMWCRVHPKLSVIIYQNIVCPYMAALHQAMYDIDYVGCERR